jgi:hypothetical protein
MLTTTPPRRGRPDSNPPVQTPVHLAFAEALIWVREDRAITRAAWASPDTVVTLRSLGDGLPLGDERLSIRYPDGRTHDLVLVRADLEATDWYVVSHGASTPIAPAQAS